MKSTIPELLSAEAATVADDGLLLLEALAVLGVLVWVAALVWMAVSDVMRFRAHHADHHSHPIRHAAYRLRHGRRE